MTAAIAKTFAIGTNVVDRDGFRGVIRNITLHDGVAIYDVMFDRGVATRFDEDLSVLP